MRILSVLVPLGLICSSVADTPEPAEAPLRRYIVEFADGIDHELAVKELQSRPNTEVVRVFANNGLFSGAALETVEDDSVSLERIEAISTAWPARKLYLQSTSEFPDINALAAPNYTVHAMTGVDKLHEQGIYGKGVKIAVIDTGIDYMHPALGSGIGPGHKILGGYDYAGDRCPKEPDEDPMDVRGHGTFVAGVIAGKNEWFTGVAPEASLLAYKVFSRESFTSDDVLIEALLDAYQADVDIITVSIDGARGWSENAVAVVADRIVDAGIVITAGAANEGAQGPFFGGTISTGEKVITVGSIHATPAARSAIDFHFYRNGTKVTRRMAYDGYWPPTDFELPVLDLGDGCTPLASSTPSLKNVLLLMSTGICDGALKGAYLRPFEPQYVFLYDSAGQNNESYGRPPYADVPYMSLDRTNAEIILAAMQAGANVSASLPGVWVGKLQDMGGYPSNFTSWASTYDLKLKPDIAAPGGEVLGLALGDRGFATGSGTSYSCPYVAGVAALYISKYRQGTARDAALPKRLAARIIASGESVPLRPSNPGFWASPTRVGGGLINATKVLMYDTELKPAKLELNDTAHFRSSYSVDITNRGTQPVTYNFGLQEATFYDAYWPSSSGGPRMKTDAELLSLANPIFSFAEEPEAFEVQAGETRTIEFKFKPPFISQWEAPYMPVYSGKLLVNGSNGEHLSIPYFGVGTDLKKDLMNLWHPTETAMYSTERYVPIAIKSSFTFNLSLEQQDFPRFHTIMTYGCKELRWDIFESTWDGTWNYPPQVGQNGYVGSATAWTGSGVFHPGIHNASNIVAFPMTYLSRNIEHEWPWLGRLANGSEIAPGKYKIRIAALLPFGDPRNASDWNVWSAKNLWKQTIDVVSG